ncbi:MAG: glycosyltransferase family 4 protein [Deltaproteobacteria bacterium]|nr:glycosyltransferase family 4 protein [Deltaproteobacteria bacterium]
MLVFDTSALGDFKAHTNRGIGRFVRNLVNALRLVGAKIKYVDLSRFVVVEKLINFLPRGKDLARNHVSYFLNSLKLGNDDVVLIPTQTDAPFLLSCNYILIVHDVIPFKYPELYGARDRFLRYKIARFFERRGIQRAKGIIAISHHVKDDLVNLFGLDPERIKVCYQGIDDLFFNQPIGEQKFNRKKLGFREDKKLFLYYGGCDARKNLKLFFEVAEYFQDIFFVVVAPIDDVEKQKLMDRIPNLVIRSPCTDEELIQYILISDCLFFPSLDEGFGLPVFEVSAIGKPVLANRIRPFVDLFTDELWYFEPHFESAKECIKQFLKASEDQIRNRVSRAQKIAKSFTWANAVKQFKECIFGFGYDL